MGGCGMGGCGCGGWMWRLFFFSSLLLFLVAVDLACGGDGGWMWWLWYGWVDVVADGAGLRKRETQREEE